jgi:MarR family transcriptional regulator for hemolysin
MAAPEPKSSSRRSREYDVAQDIGYALTHTTRAYQRALNAELAPYGVTIRQSQVLGWLRKNGDLSQCQLARLLTIEPATLAGVLERMERDGLILRLADRSDRRRKLIRLNKCAEELGDTVVECSERVCARAVQGLRPQEIDALRGLLKRILNNLGEH